MTSKSNGDAKVRTIDLNLEYSKVKLSNWNVKVILIINKKINIVLVVHIIHIYQSIKIPDIQDIQNIILDISLFSVYGLEA